MCDPLDFVFETPNESLAHYLKSMAPRLAQAFRKEFFRAKWVSVENNLPPNLTKVLMIVRDGDEQFYRIGGIVGGQWFDKNVEPIETAGVRVTHWMSLPNPPAHEAQDAEQADDAAAEKPERNRR